MTLEGDQEVAVNREKESAPRTRDDRLRTRLTRVQAIAESKSTAPGGDQVARAIVALRKLYDQGRRELTHLRVRRNFVLRRAPAPGEMSDRRPPGGPRPPVLDLISPNGIAQQLELVALFVAQCFSHHRQDGRVRALGPSLEPTDANQPGWIDVVVPHAEHSPESVYAADLRGNRLRQVKRALDTLVSKQLVTLPNAGSARGKYNDFRLLDEGGPRLFGDPVAYQVPAAGEAVIDLPVEFFLQGWVYVLSKSEIALYFMLRDLSRAATAAGSATSVSIYGNDRLRLYGVSKDAYKTWWLLQFAGLVDVEADLARRSNGTVIGFDPAGPPDPHKFVLLDDGLAKPAAAAVIAAIAARLEHEPTGLSLVRGDDPFGM